MIDARTRTAWAGETVAPPNRSLTRRAVMIGIVGACSIPVVSAHGAERAVGEPASGPATSCLPPVLYAATPSAADIAMLKDEILRERGRQTEYYANAQGFLARLATAAARLSNALELPANQRPDIILAASRAWRSVDRRYSDNGREIIFLSKTDTLPDGKVPPPENMLFAILAHEFGHAYQFVRGFASTSNGTSGSTGLSRSIREIELHADFMAGFSLARSEEKYGKPDDLLRQFSDTILNLGDYNFAPCTHHGTPAERYTMMMKGYIEAQRDQTTSPAAASQTALALLAKRLTNDSPESRESNVCLS
jgi:hypothetical protein